MKDIVIYIPLFILFIYLCTEVEIVSMVDPFLTFESLSAGMMRWVILLLLWCFLLRLYSLIFPHFNAKNIPPLCFPTSFISSFNVSFISILISLLFNLTTEIFVNSVGSSVTFRRRSELVLLIDLFPHSDSFYN